LETEREKVSLMRRGLPELERRPREAQVYEAAFERDEDGDDRRQSPCMRIDEKEAKRDGWRSGREDQNDPEPQQGASHLLSQMTGVQRSAIQVEEEFNVIADGRRLETLSGSGKACADPALRIGLGRR
jgi:DNA repair protein SbcC/Rad50